ncbi:cupredoxin domain-containing protein [Ornithinimicrobium cryptoxanthini]|uniref:Cupredoxin domain-containing protein n=1 Tax=Ornithinimicrobium cryptoxanthini TaxID=2934161 RepID=A0ABY4YFR9_9MICO|nr:cupredoxin domain-containing protein [Ornithinimicrobium cryptoxanthini]USQ75509.1 cupredoxin domain-containing protein [Ornithinimicrobium cryptoxanthini]
MTQTATTQTSMTQTTARTRASTTWRQLFRIGCWTVLVTAGLLQAIGRFVGPSLVVLMLGMAAALLLLARQRPRAAAVTAAVICVLDLVLHLGLLIGLLLEPEAFAAFILNLAGLLAVVAVMVAAVPLWRRSQTATLMPSGLLAGAVVVLVVGSALSATAYLTRVTIVPEAGEVVITNDGQVRPDEVTLPVGDPTLVFHNDDPLFPRSFDIDALDTHVTLPPNTARRVTLPARPGEYAFYDMVTFTDGTRGTLLIVPKGADSQQSMEPQGR